MEFFHQNMTTATFGAFILIFILYCYKSWTFNAAKNRRAPPEAGGGWPFIGHLPLLGGSNLPHKTLASLADKQGPIFSIRLGVHQAVVVSGSELAKEIFTNFDLIASSRPKFLAAEHLGYDYAMFGFSPCGAYWRRLRKITAIELLSSRRLELLKNVRISEADSAIKELYNYWDKKKIGLKSGNYVLVDMKKWFGDLTLNVILRMVAGKRYFGDNIESGDVEEARRCKRVLRNLFYFLGMLVVADVVPALRWLDIGGYEKGMKRAREELDDMFEGWLEEHRRKSAAGDGGGEQDFMDVMMSVADGGDLGGYDSDTVVKSTCLV